MSLATPSTASASAFSNPEPTSTTATTSLTQSIEKLDGSMASGRSNYQAWKFRIIRILKEKGLLRAIEGELDRSDSKDIARDNAAFTILTLNIKDSQITHIQECGTAREAWDALKTVHQGIGACGRMVLLQRLWGLRMVEGEDMAEHLSKFRELANQVESLSATGKGMEDNELVTILSLSLPASYEPVIMALQSRADEVSLDTFTGKLLQESARRQIVDTTQHRGSTTGSNAAFTARFTPRGRGHSRGHYGPGRRGRTIASGLAIGRAGGIAGFGKGAQTSKVKGKCFYCQKEGHWKRDCFKRKADEAKEPTHQLSTEQAGLAFTVLDHPIEIRDNTIWIIDSGASQYLCNTKEIFLRGTYQQITHRGIEIADGSRIEAVGKGDIQIGNLRLTGVLYVPRVGGNLISVGRLIDCGYEVSFTANKCMISQGGLCLQGKHEGNLYYLLDHSAYDQANLGLATNKSIPKPIVTWHCRLGHRTLDQSTIKYLQDHVSELAILPSKEKEDGGGLCETCALGRQRKEPMTGKREKVNELLEVVHSDVCGPMQVSTITGERFFVTFIDEKSGRIAVTLLKTKSEVLGAFQTYRARAEKEAGRAIKTLRTDGGGEYTSGEFKAYLRINGIAHTISPPYTPSQNGLAERANRTLMESARCMIEGAKVNRSFWGFAVATAAHIHNRVPSRAHHDLAPLEHWTGNRPRIWHLRIFGSVTYTLVPEEKRQKLDSRSVKCILIGYDEDGGSKVYRLYNPQTKRIFSSRHVIIDELSTGNTVSHENEFTSELLITYPEETAKGLFEEEEEDRFPPEPARQDSPLSDSRSKDTSEEEFGGDTIVVRPPAKLVESTTRQVSQSALRRSERKRNQEQPLARAMLAYIDEPQTLNEALERDDGDLWYEAWESEVDSLVRNRTWVLTSLPAGREPIGCRWLFKRKGDGRYKARLVAKGYSQKAGLDYTETFAPVAKFSSLRFLLALVSENDWELEGMDVKTAFLHSELEEKVYMDLPEGLHTNSTQQPSGTRMVCELRKSIYGLKQSPRTWYGRINGFFIDHGFQRSKQDHNVYVHKIFKLILLLYVDDLVLTAPSMEDIAWIQRLLHDEVQMTDLGPLTSFLGMEIQRHRPTRILHLSQQRYITSILERHGMSESSPISTPADPHVRLLKSPPDHNADSVNQQRYQSAVGSLMYAMIGTRPDIAFAVSAVSQHNNNPGAAHWTAVRRIFRYLNGTRSLGLNYGTGECGGYTDADWGGGENRRSIGGYTFCINGAAVSWASKKQPCVALSSTGQNTWH